jgi:hypothetical protein
MCLVKKHELELRRMLVTNHCVATLKDSGLVDLCLFSGEGKPTLLGGYVLSPQEAFELGKGLISTGAFLERATEEEKKKVIHDNVIMIYKLLKDVNEEQAEKLKDLFDIKIVPDEKQRTDHGYIG